MELTGLERPHCEGHCPTLGKSQKNTVGVNFIMLT